MLKHIGRYELLDVLGQGNMAIVYKAHDPNINRTLAIKVMRDERCANLELRSRFLREAKAVGILNHPNIVTIYDVGEENGVPYIAMELLDGEPIDRLLHQKIPLSRTLDIGIQIAVALHYAHSQNIIHRDIKPSNIILCRDGKIAKVTDFGIARIDTTDITRHTQVGNILGTPQYMSPEQVLGEHVDSRTDLFSLGVILYQMICGEKPYKAETLTKLLFQIATDTPTPIGELKPGLPKALENLVDKLLAKDAKDRFQTGADVAKKLEHIQNELNPPTLVLSTNVEDKKRAVKGIGLALVLLFGGVTSLLFYHNQETNRLATHHHNNIQKTVSLYLSDVVAEYLLSQDIRALNVLMSDFKTKFHLRSTIVSDHTGHIVAADNESWIDKDVSEINNTSLTYVRHPISYGSQTIGEVFLSRDTLPSKHTGLSLLMMFSLGIFSVLFIVLLRIAHWSK